MKGKHNILHFNVAGSIIENRSNISYLIFLYILLKNVSNTCYMKTFLINRKFIRIQSLNFSCIRRLQKSVITY